MKLWVAVTDNGWFRHLRGRPELEEVCFWLPGGHRPFKALAPGEPFLFKLQHPESAIVGGAFFAASSLLPASFVWDCFGPATGMATAGDMRHRIERHRHLTADPRSDYTIGCVVLQRPFFFDEVDWIPTPDDFSKNVSLGKLYDAGSAAGRALWEAARLRMLAAEAAPLAQPQSELFEEVGLVRPRLGPGGFRLLVTEAYSRRCAVTGGDALATLDATHIRPPARGGQHRIDNGMLLRADLRALFASGHLTVTPDHTVRVSGRLAAETAATADYQALDGCPLRLPRRPEERPRREFLEWHAGSVFRG